MPGLPGRSGAAFCRVRDRQLLALLTGWRAGEEPGSVGQLGFHTNPLPPSKQDVGFSVHFRGTGNVWWEVPPIQATLTQRIQPPRDPPAPPGGRSVLGAQVPLREVPRDQAWVLEPHLATRGAVLTPQSLSP